MFVRHSIFGGSATAMVTPMSGYGDLDFDAFGGPLEWMIGEGTDAMVVNGTTGESAILDDKEKMVVICYAVKQVGGRISVIAGTGSSYTEHTIELPRKAQELRADALLQVTPYYNKASQDGLVRHFTQVTDYISTPILLYNVPNRTGMIIQPETHKILSEHPNIWGTKEASGGLSLITKAAALCGEGLDIYSSNNGQTVPITSLGNKGVVSVLVNIMPREIHQTRCLYLDGDMKESRQMQPKLLEIMEVLFWDVNPVPVKVALCTMEARGGDLHLPLTPMEPRWRGRLAEATERQGISLRKELHNQTDLL